MGYANCRRRGHLWDDMHRLHELITTHNFNVSVRQETDFERYFSGALNMAKDSYHSRVITQINRDEPVHSVYCFGKKHRPDMTLGVDGAAIELKLIDGCTDGLKVAIGQAHLYRLKYKHAVLILVVSHKNRQLYEKIVNKEEKDLEDILRAQNDTNIYTYIVPAFDTGNRQRCLSYFPADAAVPA